MKRLLFAALLALAAGCGTGVPGLPGPTPTPSIAPSPLPSLWPLPASFGVQTHLWPYTKDPDTGQWRDGKVNTAELQAAYDGGFFVIRLPLLPSETPVDANGNYDFGPLVAEYYDILSTSHQPLFTIENPHSDADLLTDVAYAQQVAPLLENAWFELGNEPNTGTGPPGWYKPITAAQYWAGVKPIAAALHAGAPYAQISTGGTSGLVLDWQRGLIAAGAARSGLLTAFSAHPYGENPIEPGGVSGGSLAADLATFKALLPPSITIWQTEYSEDPWTVPDVQTWLTVEGQLNAPLFVVYELADDTVDGKLSPRGLLNEDLSHKWPDPYAAAQAILTTP